VLFLICSQYSFIKLLAVL